MVRGSLGSFKASPYGADHNLLPHLKQPEVGTRCCFTFRKTHKRSAGFAVRDRDTTAIQRSLQQKIRSGLVGVGPAPWRWTLVVSPSRRRIVCQALWILLQTETLDIPVSYHCKHFNCCNDDNMLSLRCLACCYEANWLYVLPIPLQLARHATYCLDQSVTLGDVRLSPSKDFGLKGEERNRKRVNFASLHPSSKATCVIKVYIYCKWWFSISKTTKAKEAKLRLSSSDHSQVTFNVKLSF